MGWRCFPGSFIPGRRRRAASTPQITRRERGPCYSHCPPSASRDLAIFSRPPVVVAGGSDRLRCRCGDAGRAPFAFSGSRPSGVCPGWGAGCNAAQSGLRRLACVSHAPHPGSHLVTAAGGSGPLRRSALGGSLSLRLGPRFGRSALFGAFTSRPFGAFFLGFSLKKIPSSWLWGCGQAR